MKKILFLIVLIYGCSFSQEEKVKANFLITGALELGGDKLGTIFFADGSTQNIYAGQGGTISIGAELNFLKTNGLFLRGTLGYKYVTTKADNVHIRLTRIPMELTANWNFSKKFWTGLGIVTHSSIKLKFDGLAKNENYQSSLGQIIKIGYGGIGLSYTIMSYKDRLNNKYSANSVGLIMVVPIPNKAWKN